MSMAILIVGALACFELFFRLPIAKDVRVLIASANKAMAVIQSPMISDHWKERVLPRYSQRILFRSLRVSGYIFLAMMPVVAAVAIGQARGENTLDIVLGWQGLVGLSLAGMVFAGLRSKLAAQST